MIPRVGLIQRTKAAIEALLTGVITSHSHPGGTGSGDVVGPATNSADYIPQWDGANSKTLKNGVAIPAGGLAGLTALGNKVDKVTGSSLVADTEITKLGTIAANATVGADWLSNLANIPTSFPPEAHNQSATTITTGELDGDRLPAISATKKGAVPLTGTPSGKFLKDDNTWAAVTASLPDTIYTKNSIGVNTTIPAGYSHIVSDELIILDTFEFELADTAYSEIT